MPHGRPRVTCRRCAACCRAAGPALHEQDLDLVGTAFTLADLMTLRAGEPAFDQPAKAVRPLAAEIVKLAGLNPEAGRWDCVFLTEQGCGIYASRPLECRLLDCRDTSALENAYASGRLTRLDILPPESALAEIVRLHEERCPMAEALTLAREHRMAHARLDEMLAFDRSLRATLTERDFSPPLLRFLLGRPLDAVLRAARTAPGAFATRP